MSGFDEIVTFNSSATEVPQGLPLVIALSGFSDAGQLVPQLDHAILGEGGEMLVAQFTRDILYDYRARRPVAQFDGTEVIDVDMPELELSLVQSGSGKPFLYLHGYEPDFRWDAVVACIEEFIAEFSISSVTTFHAIPMPVPHTRPVQSSVSGNRDELRSRWSVWKPRTQIPASILHVLEFRLFEDTDNEIPFSSFVLLVPHYLADSELPTVLRAAIERLADATGIEIIDQGLAMRESEFLGKVAEQVDDSGDLSVLVEGLERRYDEYMASVARAQRQEVDMENLPTADEIAAEFESFLAAQSKENDSDK